MFDLTLPLERMFWGLLVGGGEREGGGVRTSIWSLVQESMDMDLTLEMWVPSLRWREAHRMQRKTPNCGHGRVSFCTGSHDVVKLCI